MSVGAFVGRWQTRGSTRCFCFFWIGFIIVLNYDALWLHADTASRSVTSDQIKFGVDGRYRVGQWTAIRMAPGATNSFANPSTQTTLETTDGEGVRVQYTYLENRHSSEWRYVIPGMAEATLRVEHLSSDDPGSRKDTPWTGRFPNRIVPSERPWILVLGDPLGVESIGKNDLLKRPPTVETTVVKEVIDLPDHWLGYESFDVLIITATASDWLQNLNQSQTDAIFRWVQRGGSVLVTLGATGPKAIERCPLIGRLLGTDRRSATTVRMDPAAIETFTKSKVPSDYFEGTRLPTTKGSPLLVGRTETGKPLPIAMRYSVGLGHVMAIAADLDQFPFSQWPQRTEWLTAMNPEMVPVKPRRQDRSFSGQMAYTDMAGQVRAKLDLFSEYLWFPFSVFCAVILVLFLFVGPLDYFLVNRWLRRPRLGWLTLPLIVLVTGGTFIGLSLWGKKKVTTHHVEWIDIDSLSGTGQAFSWTHLFSPASQTWNIHYRPKPALSQNVSNQTLIAAPFGFSGNIFGGVPLNQNRMPPYRVSMVRDNQGIQGHLQGLSFAPMSSKGFAGWWDFEISLTPQSGLSGHRSSELRGYLKNPLTVDLLDGVLLFDDWAYLLPTRFQAGTQIDSVETLRQKNFRWLLTRRKALESASSQKSWDASDAQEMDRLVEILSFYNIAGGSNYTGLTNHPLRRLDRSRLLDDQRAILMGRLDRPVMELEIHQEVATDSKKKAPVSFDEDFVSVVRIQLPVQSHTPSSNDRLGK